MNISTSPKGEAYNAQFISFAHSGIISDIIFRFLFKFLAIGIHALLPCNLLRTGFLGLAGLKFFHLLLQVIVCHGLK